MVTGFKPFQLLQEEMLILSTVSHLGSLRVMPGDIRLCQFSGHMAKHGWLQLALSSFSLARCGGALLLCSRASQEVGTGSRVHVFCLFSASNLNLVILS